jgi:transposase
MGSSRIARTFQLSRDPQFEEKLTDVFGLYLNSPDKALVFCADEKSQIQALDRTQPGLPLKKGRGATMTHDSKRHGTTTLFAALYVLTSKLIGTCQRRHRHQEWLRFLTLLDQHTPPTQPLHLIGDNYATHKHPAVLRWLKRHPRFHMHCIPASSSWLNLIEPGSHRPLQFRRGRVSGILDPVHEPRRLVEKLSCECRGAGSPRRSSRCSCRVDMSYELMRLPLGTFWPVMAEVSPA